MKFRAPKGLRGTLDQVSRIRHDARLLLWSMVVLLFPFYFFESGLPQPADVLSLILLVMLLRSWNGRMPGPLVGPLKSLIWFIAYVLLLNVAWSVILLTFSINAKEGFLMAPSFYIFNGLMFFTFLLMFQRYGEFLLWLTARLILASVLIQTFFAAVMRAAIGRSTVMFNNPNQLGYYALLSACILLLSQKRLRLSTVQVTLGLAACAYLGLLSASKAALTSIAALSVALMFSRIRTIVVAGVVFGFLIFTENPFSAAIDHARQRIDNDQSYGFVEERGYDRIFDYPEYTIIGAGEGGYNRFKETSLIGAHELHSSMGTLFFCYGFVGVGLFGLFMWRVMRRSGIRAWIIVGTGFAYSMTHQGLRFRLLWLLLGIVVALRELETQERRARQAAKAAAKPPGRPGGAPPNRPPLGSPGGRLPPSGATSSSAPIGSPVVSPTATSVATQPSLSESSTKSSADPASAAAALTPPAPHTAS